MLKPCRLSSAPARFSWDRFSWVLLLDWSQLRSPNCVKFGRTYSQSSALNKFSYISDILLLFKTWASEMRLGGARIHFVAPSSQSLVDRIIDTHNVSFRFLICCSVSKPDRLEGNWCRKSGQNFAFWPPVKFREGADKMSESTSGKGLLLTVYGQNGNKPKRRQFKTATPKRRLSKTATSQNGDKPKRRQVHGEITETATNQKVDIATQYERAKE